MTFLPGRPINIALNAEEENEIEATATQGQPEADEGAAAPEAARPSTRDYLRMQIPSHPRFVALVRDLLYRFCLQFGFTRQGAFDMKLVCGEALANIIQHAYRGEDNRPIFVEFYMYHDYLELRLRDMGLQQAVPPGSAQDLTDYRERGLGLFLIRKLSDFHYFDQSFKIGTMLVIKKKVQ